MPEDMIPDSTASHVDRRTLLRTAGGALVAGAGVAGLGGSAAASHCPDPSSDEDYWDCDDPSNEFEFMYRPYSDHIKGETSLMVGDKDLVYDNCNPCVTYFFDIVGIHEAVSEERDGSTKDYLESFGFRWDVSGAVTPDPQPDGSSNVQSGVTDPDGDANPYDEVEEAIWSLGDALVAGGSVVYPALGPAAFLYTVARASDVGNNVDDDNDEVRFNPGWDDLDSAGFGYYNMRLQVHEDYCGTVEFEGFTEAASREVTTTTKTFDLGRHTRCSP